jgi:hypothetical protein
MFELMKSHAERLLWNPQHSEAAISCSGCCAAAHVYAVLRDAVEGHSPCAR